MREFYVHKFREGKLNSRSPRGFTALIKPDPANHLYVYIQVTYCHPKDTFCKKLGRENVALTKEEKFNKREVPRVLSALARTCELEGEGAERYWYWIYRYLL